MIYCSLKQGDILSANLFNLIWEKVITETEINKCGWIFNRTLQYSAYADDVNLVAKTSHTIKEAFQL
jgi:hypothetical protein